MTFDDLKAKSQAELDELFKASPAGPIPNGDAQGQAIVCPGSFWSRLIARFVHALAWQGKVFDAEHGVLRNRISAFGLNAIVATVYKGPSWLDQKECIVIDYSKTSTVAQWIRDEIREIEPGTYLGACAEYCGTQHTLMLLRIVAEPPDQFARWVEQQRQAAAELPSDSVAAAGRRVFLGTVCMTCHTVAGTDAKGRLGPDLTHLMSRATIGAGAAPNTRESLLSWVRNPDNLKHGSLMPAMQIDEKYLHQLVEYLLTLR